MTILIFAISAEAHNGFFIRFSVGPGFYTEQSGVAINLSLDKEWLIAKRWGAGIGAHGFIFKTSKIEYEFIQFGINGIITFNFTPVR